MPARTSSALWLRFGARFFRPLAPAARDFEPSRQPGSCEVMQPGPADVTDDPWMAAMCCGNLEAAWAISDAILVRRKTSGQVCGSWPRHLQFIWNGDALAGRRVLVRCY